jgi:anthranilate synthase/aminodeoxychorismate synthase-like glutamine amidotransferase
LKIAFIDNFDSFTFNLIHYFKNTGSEVELFHNHELFKNQEKILKANAVVIGPGPNTPNDAGELMSFIALLVEFKFPIFGICLGQQAIGQFFGMNLKLAKLPMHGKTSEIVHAQNSIFSEMRNPMKVGRYHSLIVEMTEHSTEIEPIAHCESEIMAIKHVSLPICAVQFHPESVLTPVGQILIQNWVNLLR